jgi:Tfp pilus assembly pilus retraction ATPase PilT
MKMVVVPVNPASLKTKKDAVHYAEEAAKHHTDLNVLSAVTGSLESGALYTSGGRKAADRIIKICKIEQRRQLKLYDSNLDKVKQCERSLIAKR